MVSRNNSTLCNPSSIIGGYRTIWKGVSEMCLSIDVSSCYHKRDAYKQMQCLCSVLITTMRRI